MRIAFGISALIIAASVAQYVHYITTVPKQLKVIADPVTNCQYVSYAGAMYPRLDAYRKHICDPSIPMYSVEISK